MNEQLPPSHIILRVILDLLLMISALALPLPYVIVFGLVNIMGFGMYEGVIAGLLFDAVHTALFGSIALGEFPVTALFLVFVTCGVIARRVLFYVHPQ